MWLWGYKMPMARDSRDRELLYTAMRCMTKPGAHSNANGMASERKVPPQPRPRRPVTAQVSRSQELLPQAPARGFAFRS